MSSFKSRQTTSIDREISPIVDLVITAGVSYARGAINHHEGDHAAFVTPHIISYTSYKELRGFVTNRVDQSLMMRNGGKNKEMMIMMFGSINDEMSRVITTRTVATRDKFIADMVCRIMVIIGIKSDANLKFKLKLMYNSDECEIYASEDVFKEVFPGDYCNFLMFIADYQNASLFSFITRAGSRVSCIINQYAEDGEPFMIISGVEAYPCLKCPRIRSTVCAIA